MSAGRRHAGWFDGVALVATAFSVFAILSTVMILIVQARARDTWVARLPEPLMVPLAIGGIVAALATVGGLFYLGRRHARRRRDRAAG